MPQVIEQSLFLFLFHKGLFLEGASLDRKTGKLVESRPKVLYEQMPVIYIYAINTTAGKVNIRNFPPKILIAINYSFLNFKRTPSFTSAPSTANHKGLTSTTLALSTLRATSGQGKTFIPKTFIKFEYCIFFRHWTMRGVALLCDIK